MSHNTLERIAMSKIIPAIIPESFSHLETSLKRVSTFTREVQVDVVDGKFVPFTSWPYGEGESVEQLASLTEEYDVEVDLMLENPEEVLEDYVVAGVKRAVVHIESTSHISAIIEHSKMRDFQLGLSINNDTALEMLTRHISNIDFVQLMGIANIGSQGQPFDERVLERVEYLKAQHPTLEISIDGSVNSKTLQQLVKVGADRFVSGSAILKAENPETVYRSFENVAA